MIFESINLFDDLSECQFFNPLNGKFVYYPNFFNRENSDRYFNYLLNDIPWQQDKIKMFGKEHLIPRLASWFGDQDITYTYSGITMYPNNWSEELLEIKFQIEKKLNKTFNSLLLNQYRDGNDNMSWHADDEKELGSEILIASISFGATRDFQFKHKIEKSENKINIPLEHGSMLVMFPPTQEYWVHQIPKRKKVISPRVNLTFRNIIK